MSRCDLLCLLALVACDAPSSTPDAPVTDDAAVDAPGELVEVHVSTELGDGLPETRAVVVFAGPNDQLLAVEAVDAQGDAAAHVPPGGSVTVLVAYDEVDQLDNVTGRTSLLTTFRGVQPGDQLHAGRPATPETRTGATSTMFASYTPVSTMGASISMLTACADTSVGTAGEPFGLLFYASCTKPTFDLLAITNGDDSVRRFVWLDDAPYAAGSTIAVPNAWVPVESATVSYANVPAGLTRVASWHYTSIEGRLHELQRASVETPAGPTHQRMLERYAGAGDATVLSTSLVRGLTLAETRVQVTAATPTAFSVDFAAMPLPTVSNVAQTGTGLSWQETYAGTPDARLALWAGTWIDTNQLRHTAKWTVIEPPTPATSTTLPTLPPAYASDDPTRVNGPTLTAKLVQYLDYSNVNGYDAARGHGPALAEIEARFLDVDHEVHVSRGN